MSGLKENFIRTAYLIKRDGINEFIEWLKTTDFFEAPSSTLYHSNYEGGLVEHSLLVTKFALHNFNLMVKEKPDLEYLRESVVVSALFHDVCKIDTYKRAKKWTKDENDKWKEYYGWEKKEDLPLPHATKSLFLIGKYVKLTNPEALAIAYHMGAFNPSYCINGMEKMTFEQALEHPLVKLIISSDMLATTLEEVRNLKN